MLITVTMHGQSMWHKRSRDYNWYCGSKRVKSR